MNSGTPTVTAGTGCTELYDVAYTDWYVAQGQARTGSTSQAFGWDDVIVGGGGYYHPPCAVAIEVVAAASGGTVNTSTLTETVSLSDAALSQVIRNRLLQSLLDVTDGPLSASTLTNRIVNDSIEVTDEALRFVLRRRLLSEGVDISDAAIAQLLTGNILLKILTDGLTITDAALPLVLRNRLIVSLVMLNDQSLTAMQRFLVLSDAIAIDDQLISSFITQTTAAPRIVIGFDQPRIEVGGYGI